MAVDRSSTLKAATTCAPTESSGRAALSSPKFGTRALTSPAPRQAWRAGKTTVAWTRVETLAATWQQCGPLRVAPIAEPPLHGCRVFVNQGVQVWRQRRHRRRQIGGNHAVPLSYLRMRAGGELTSMRISVKVQTPPDRSRGPSRGRSAAVLGVGHDDRRILAVIATVGRRGHGVALLKSRPSLMAQAMVRTIGSWSGW